jgi:hypothetical protein
MSKRPKPEVDVTEVMHVGPRETIELLMAANKLLDECRMTTMIKRAKAMNAQARAVIKQAVKQAKAKLKQL